MHTSTERRLRKTKIGVVVSNKMDKTITVKVDRVGYHAMYKKMLRQATKFKVHDEKEAAAMGDTVKIEETRPLSKTKCWRLVEIVKKAGIQSQHDTAPDAGSAKKAG